MSILELRTDRHLFLVIKTRYDGERRSASLFEQHVLSNSFVFGFDLCLQGAPEHIPCESLPEQGEPGIK